MGENCPLIPTAFKKECCVENRPTVLALKLGPYKDDDADVSFR
jgi:hypothetical protein